jgi:hypothetical protein
LGTLSRELPALVRTIQGLLLYDAVATDWYGVVVPDERGDESHLRGIERMLDRLLALDDQSLTLARPPQKRLLGSCHHFMLLLVATLRAHGVSARGRCGFGSYFNPPYFEDHWVCEYFNVPEVRWIRVDSQLDDVWRKKLGIDFDILDVPHDRFLTAGDAWRQCRAGAMDASKLGIFKGDLRGLWFVAGDLVRDVAALAKVEMLPWDVWGAQPRPGEALAEEALAFFDHLAEITRTPDEAHHEILALQQNDERVRVPDRVFNALRQRQEMVAV